MSCDRTNTHTRRAGGALFHTGVLATVAVLLAGSAVLPVHGWGCTGHMLVVEVAQRHLTPENRLKSDALASSFADGGPFPKNPDLVQIACWADDLKGWHQYAMKPWHYVDIPYNPDNLTLLASPYVGLAQGRPEAVAATAATSAAVNSPVGSGHPLRVQEKAPGDGDCGCGHAHGSVGRVPSYYTPQPIFPRDLFDIVVNDDENGGNVVTAIRNMVVALQAKKAPPYSYHFALANLVHFVGDIHQPLHATTRYTKEYPNGDHGGNAVKVLVHGKETSLHSLWDNLCAGAKPHNPSRPMHDEAYDNLRAYADTLEDTYKFPKELISETVASAMAWESHMFAINTTYPGVEAGEELSEEYLDRCREVTEARVTLAGRRLGNILNSLLDNLEVDMLTMPHAHHHHLHEENDDGDHKRHRHRRSNSKGRRDERKKTRRHRKGNKRGEDAKKKPVPWWRLWG